MYNLDQIYSFFMNKQSTKAAVENFVEQFFQIYEELEQKEKEILELCVQQMFRKYYYSDLIPDRNLTPSTIINTLVERELGNDLVVQPILKLNYRGNELDLIDLTVITYQQDEHPMVKDMELFLELAGSGVKVLDFGIVSAEEHNRFSSMTINDRHYFNILSMAALESGMTIVLHKGKTATAKISPKGKEFLQLDARQKLQLLIDAVIKLCSSAITRSYPELKGKFSDDGVRRLLTSPKNIEELLLPIFNKVGIDISMIVGFSAGFMEGANNQPSEEELLKMAEFVSIQQTLDMFFSTPFGYYLQLIQPVYPDSYDIQEEVGILLLDTSDFQNIRTKLFTIPAEYDLTSLGELLLVKGGKKPKRQQVIPSDIGDQEMYEAVLGSRVYVEEYEYDDLLSEFLELMSLQMTNKKPTKKGTKKNGKKVVAMEAKIKDKSDADNKVFVFKAKLFYNKRVWRQYELKGDHTLHDLHEAVFEGFDLEPGHLYAFFMSNKAWDSSSEFSDPQADGPNAKKAKIGSLDLPLKKKFLYIYDFGDEHRFEIELVDIKEVDKGAKYPRETKRSKALL